MMKVLLAATGGEFFSGASHCLLELAEKLISRGIEVIVIIPGRGDVEQELRKRDIRYFFIHEYHSWYISDHCQKNKFQLKRLVNLLSIYKIKNLIKREAIDLIHVNALTAYTAGKAAIELGKPVVWHIREFMEEDLNISFYNKRYSLTILNRANCCIAISHSIYEKWSNILNLPLIVVNDGVPVNNYYVEEKKRHNKINVLLYGRIVTGKGQDFYIKGAIKALESIVTACEFYFAGKIEDQEYYQKCCCLIKESSFEHKIHYIGEIANIKELLSRTDLVCVCSKMEGFGRVTVEAMLGKCLVLGTDTGATGEIVKDRETGLLYRSDDLEDFVRKLKDAVNCYNDYEQIITDGQRYALEHFSIDRNVDKIIEIYRAVMQERM